MRPSPVLWSCAAAHTQDNILNLMLHLGLAARWQTRRLFQIAREEPWVAYTTSEDGLRSPPLSGREAYRILAVGGSTTACAFLDANRDGHLDLYTAHYLRWSAAEEKSCGGEIEGFRSYCPPDQYRAEADRLFLGDGRGAFRDATRELGLGGRGKWFVSAGVVLPVAFLVYYYATRGG